MNELKKIFSQRLKEERKLKGLTQKQLAEEMGIKQQAYARFENCIFEFNYEQLVFIAKRLDNSLDYFFGLD